MDSAHYGQNPLLRVPTLVDGDLWIPESDHIARYVVTALVTEDPLNVLTPTTAELKQLAVLNGIMAHEVTIIMATHGGMSDVMTHTYFQKLAKAMTSGLLWLDRDLDTERKTFNYIDVATLCMWQHLLHYRTLCGLQSFQRIAHRVARFSDRQSVVDTLPAAFIQSLV